MKNKRRILLFVLLAAVGVSVRVYFITRPQQEEIYPQKFAQLPEKPTLITEFNHGTTFVSDEVQLEGFTLLDASIIYSIKFSPVDASLIASVNSQGNIKLWNLDNIKKPVRTFTHPGIFPSIGFSPTGELLASEGGGILVLWDVDSGTKINTIEHSSREFAFSSDGLKLATVHNDVKIWDIQNPKQITEIAMLPFEEVHRIRSWACAVSISADGKMIAAGYASGLVNIWNLQTKQHVKTLRTPYAEMRYLKFSPDNKYLVCGGPIPMRHIYLGKNKHDSLGVIGHGAQGYMMWRIPSWERHGEVQRGNIDKLIFSPDGKVCASMKDRAYSNRSVQLWSIESGAPITALPSQTIPRDIAFSHDSNLIVIGDFNGGIKVWEHNAKNLESTTPSKDIVRIAYRLNKDQVPSPNITEKIDETIREVQDFYADEMERHGFDRKTFRFETDENGKAKVYLANYHPNNMDSSNDIWLSFRVRQSAVFPIPILDYFDHIHSFEYTNKDSKRPRDGIASGDIEGIALGRHVSIGASKLNRKSIAYLLRGTFGLLYIDDSKKPNFIKRLYTRVNDAMPWGKRWAKLSKCEAEVLDKSRFFNQNHPFFDKYPTMDLHITSPKTSGLRYFIFDVTDEDGIHQVQLYVPRDSKDRSRGNKLHECQTLNGKDKEIVGFEITNPEIKNVRLRLIDMLGNIASREFSIIEKTSQEE